MIKAPLYTIKGEQNGTVSLPDHIFAAPAHDQLTVQYLRVYQSNQRSAHASTKTRGEVAHSTAKIWRQKGTGRARHGSKKAPIFVGGGVAHGPRGNQNYTLKFPKRMRQLVTASALTQKVAQNHLSLIDSLKDFEPKTSVAQKLFQTLTHLEKTVIILDKPHAHFLKAIHNLAAITPVQAHNVNAHEILNHQHVIITQPALEVLTARFPKPALATAPKAIKPARAPKKVAKTAPQKTATKAKSDTKGK
jgi:large subunit ribosomal protein L4